MNLEKGTRKRLKPITSLQPIAPKGGVLKAFILVQHSFDGIDGNANTYRPKITEQQNAALDINDSTE